MRRILAAVVVVACTDDGGPGPSGSDVELIDGALVVDVGPDGLVIDGSGFDGFDGVEVDIPPGALSDRVTLRVVPTAEALPLPELGEECGQGFAIDAGDAALDGSITVTLPVNDHVLDVVGQGPADVKIWALDGDVWASVDQTGSESGSVTFEIESFTSMIPGVGRVPVLDTCLTRGGCEPTTISVTPPPACPGPAFCITDLGVLPLPDASGIRYSDGTRLCDTTRPTTGTVAVVQVNPDATASFSTTASFTTSSTARANLTVPRNSGEAWVGLGTAGNVRLKFDGSAPTAFDTDTNNGLGGLSLPDGTLTRLSRLGFSTRQAGSLSFEPRDVADLSGSDLEATFFAGSDASYGGRTALIAVAGGTPPSSSRTRTTPSPSSGWTGRQRRRPRAPRSARSTGIRWRCSRRAPRARSLPPWPPGVLVPRRSPACSPGSRP